MFYCIINLLGKTEGCSRAVNAHSGSHRKLVVYVFPAEDADILGLAACNPLVRDRGTSSMRALVSLAPEVR